jgi:hypothetical protein
MAAVVTVQEWNGGAIAYTSRATPGRFACTDSATPLLTFPIPINPLGIGNYSHSWWKHFGLDLADTFTRINNVQFYSDGAIGWTFGTGGAMLVALRDSEPHGCPTGSYAQAVGSATTGTQIKDGAAGHAYYKGQTAALADVETYTSAGTKLMIDNTNHDAPEKTYAVVLQLKVDGDATLGVMNPDEQLNFSFDEI